MAVLPRPAAPSALLADLRAFLATRERHQIVALTLAIGMPVLIVLGFYNDAGPAPSGPTITYVQSWPDSRTDAEIMRQNIADQKVRDAMLAERRRQFQVVDKQLKQIGM